jgi:predicted nucleic acid-binding protein
MPSQNQVFVAEPPATYLIKPPAVVDASLLCSVLFNEPTRDQAIVHLANYELHAPQLLPFEVASVAQKKLQSHWKIDSIIETLNDFSLIDINLHAVVASDQLQLADQYHLSSYDAAYLWLAARLKAPLLTFDQSLGKAAKIHLGGL